MGKAARAVYQLHIALENIEPQIWRKIQVSEATKLEQLHKILQLLFNWENYHIHRFNCGADIYAEPAPDGEEFGMEILDHRLVPLNRVLQHVGDEITYVYDFGDNWRHRIVLEAIVLPREDAFYPCCIAGERNGPPEDVGGPHAFAEYVAAMRNRRHPRRAELLRWRGEFDPEAFSVGEINARLRRKFDRKRKSSATQ